VTDFRIYHLILITIPKLYLDWGVSLAVVELLLSESQIVKPNKFLVDEVMTFEHFHILASGTAVDFHKVGSCKITPKHVCLGRQLDRFNV
jgi:hypothetical protein